MIPRAVTPSANICAGWFIPKSIGPTARPSASFRTKLYEIFAASKRVIDTLYGDVSDFKINETFQKGTEDADSFLSYSGEFIGLLSISKDLPKLAKDVFKTNNLNK